jgi:hypothetical protein
MGTKWFVCIPERALKMRTERAVRQTQQLRRKEITAKNPRQLWIGVATPELSHDAYYRFVLEWSCRLQHGFTESWLASELPCRVPRGFGPRQSVISWIGATATTGADETLLTDQQWLTRQFPELYSAPAGWRIWPSATVSTMKGSEALMCTGYGAKRFHKAAMRAIWATTRVHWNSTCLQNAEAIRESGDMDLLNTVNSTIQDGRRSHVRAPLRLET